MSESSLGDDLTRTRHAQFAPKHFPLPSAPRKFAPTLEETSILTPESGSEAIAQPQVRSQALRLPGPLAEPVPSPEYDKWLFSFSCILLAFARIGGRLNPLGAGQGERPCWKAETENQKPKENYGSK